MSFSPSLFFALLGRRLALILSAELYEAIHGCKSTELAGQLPRGPWAGDREHTSLWDFAVPVVAIERTGQIYNPIKLFVNRGQSTRWLIHARKQFYPPLISGEKSAIKNVCSTDSWFISLLFCFSSSTGLWSMHLVHPRTRKSSPGSTCRLTTLLYSVAESFHVRVRPPVVSLSNNRLAFHPLVPLKLRVE